MIGNDDCLPWLNETINGKFLKKVTMSDANNITRALSCDDMKSYTILTKRLGILIYNPEIFKLFVLLLLFSDSIEVQGLKNVWESYLGIIQRRHNHVYNESLSHNEEDLPLGNMMYSRIKSCIIDIKKLGEILAKITVD